LKKKARPTTAAQYTAKRILSVYAEPGGLCAMMLTNIGERSDNHSAARQAWRLEGEDAWTA